MDSDTAKKIEALQRTVNALRLYLTTVYQRLDDALSAIDDPQADIPSIQELIHKDLDILKTLKDLH